MSGVREQPHLREVDEETAETISKTVIDMGASLKDIDFEKDGFSGMMKTMSEKVQINLKDKNVDKAGIKKGMDRMLSSIVIADGTPLFDPTQPMNPFAMMTRIATMTPEDQKKMGENISKTLGIDLSSFQETKK